MAKITRKPGQPSQATGIQISIAIARRGYFDCRCPWCSPLLFILILAQDFCAYHNIILQTDGIVNSFFCKNFETFHKHFTGIPKKTKKHRRSRQKPTETVSSGLFI
jgi:hypothetical protein